MITFIDEDGAYVAWRDAHADAWIVNHDPRAFNRYRILHRASCTTLSGRPAHGEAWTKVYAKTCADRRADLEWWAAANDGQLTPYGLCRP